MSELSTPEVPAFDYIQAARQRTVYGANAILEMALLCDLEEGYDGNQIAESTTSAEFSYVEYSNEFGIPTASVEVHMLDQEESIAAMRIISPLDNSGRTWIELGSIDKTSALPRQLFQVTDTEDNRLENRGYGLEPVLLDEHTGSLITNLIRIEFDGKIDMSQMKFVLQPNSRQEVPTVIE